MQIEYYIRIFTHVQQTTTKHIFDTKINSGHYVKREWNLAICPRQNKTDINKNR